MRWNKHQAALSLTFDDGLPCQRKWALPLLRKYRIPATFFLIQNSPFESFFDKETWQQALRDGHEIGSHSVNHRKAGTMLPHEALDEALNSRKFLEDTFDINVESFCYPYTDAMPFMQEASRQAGYFQARGGRIARKEKLLGRREHINYLNIPAIHIANAQIITGEVQGHIERCIEKRSWLVLMFHSVGPCETCTWDNVSSPAFETFLQYLVGKRNDLWIDTFGKVAEEHRRR